MKIAVVSHSCVVAVNQRLFVALADHPGVDGLELLVPANWRNEYNGAEQPPTLLPDVDFPVRRHPVVKPGNVSLHAYRSLPLTEWKAFRPDVLYAAQEPWSLSCFQAAWLTRQLGIPLVFHTNQNILKRYPPPFSAFEQKAYRRAGAALAYSEEARQVMVTKGLTAPSAVVPYPVELSQFYPNDAARAKRRQALGIAPDEFVIGYVGRFVPDKGLDTMVDAVAEVVAGRRDGDPDIRVLMVGAGPEEDALKARAAEKGIAERFIWTGLVPHEEAGDYIRALDTFVLASITLPNWKEQFGRVIIEAMACGVPVVGSDSGQIPYIVRETGGGLVFPEKDSGALAANLVRLLRAPAEARALGEAGRKAVAAQYRTEAVAAQLYDVFAGILGRKPAEGGERPTAVPSAAQG